MLSSTRRRRFSGEQGEEASFAAFEDVAFQDADHELLYDMTRDGLEDSSVGARLGIGHLHFDDWFEPFLNAPTPVHPYGEGPPEA